MFNDAIAHVTSAASCGDPALVIRPAPVALSRFTGARRQATRPLDARDADFDRAFDDDTLLFDAFRTADGRQIVLIGPPLFNLAAAVEGLRVREAGGRALAVRRIRRLDRQVQIWIEAPQVSGPLVVDTALGSFAVTPGDNHAALFRGCRVLLTKSRDNPLPWILDWIRFNRDANGADAVLLYDNGSTRYGVDALAAAIGGVAGLRAAAVVPWPFKFGPQGPDAKRFWDSDFCELGALEHARWRFLPEARSVQAGDIDELAVGAERTPFEAAERAPSGVARYHGRWVVATAPVAPVDQRRHRDYRIALKPARGRNRLGWPVDANRCAAKWTVVPARCPAWAQWRTHTIRHWPASYLTRGDVGFAHFRPITTSWKYARDEAASFDPARHEPHEVLATALDRVDWER